MKDDDLPEDVRIARKCTEDAIVQLNEDLPGATTAGHRHILECPG